MSYTELSKVKYKLHIGQSDTSKDTHLGELITAADSIIDDIIGNHVSTPLAGTEDGYETIVQAAGMIVAGLFLMEKGENKRTPETETKGVVIYKEGKALVKTWVDEHYKNKGSVRKTYFSHITSSNSWDAD